MDKQRCSEKNETLVRKSKRRRRQRNVFRHRWMKHVRSSTPEPIMAPYTSTRSMGTETSPSPPVSPDPMTDWEAVCGTEVDTARVTWRKWVGSFFYL